MSIGQKGHARTRADAVFVSARDPARIQISGRLAQWLPEAMQLANQVKTAEIWPEAVLWFSLDVV